MDEGYFDRGSPCPKCGKKISGYTGHPSNKSKLPTPGSIAFCLSCGSVLMLTESMTLRLPTVTESAEIMGMEKVQKMIEAWKELNDGDSQ